MERLRNRNLPMQGYGEMAHALSLYEYVSLARSYDLRGNGGTDYFKHTRVYLLRRYMAVIFQELAACWTEIFNLLRIPGNVFGVFITSGSSVCSGRRRRRHRVFDGYINERRKEGGRETDLGRMRSERYGIKDDAIHSVYSDG